MREIVSLFNERARQREYLEANEINRLFSMPDRWLAKDLVHYSRTIRNLRNDLFGAHRKDTHQRELFWDIIPEIAYRLGHRDFDAGERSDAVRRMTNNELREYAAEKLQGRNYLVSFASRLYKGMNVYSLLTRNPVLGNPVIFALDRFAPVDKADPDWASRAVFAHYKATGMDDIFAWTPDLPNHIDILSVGIPKPEIPLQDLSNVYSFPRATNVV